MNWFCDNLILRLRESFKKEEVKKNVLDNVWYTKNKEKGIDSTGFCFYASEVVYRLTGGKSRWILKRISKDNWIFGPHYFLFDKITEQILDITADQYGVEKIPYEKAKGRGLQRKSKKATLLALFVGENL